VAHPQVKYGEQCRYNTNIRYEINTYTRRLISYLRETNIPVREDEGFLAHIVTSVKVQSHKLKNSA